MSICQSCVCACFVLLSRHWHTSYLLWLYSTTHWTSSWHCFLLLFEEWQINFDEFLFLYVQGPIDCFFISKLAIYVSVVVCQVAYKIVTVPNIYRHLAGPSEQATPLNFKQLERSFAKCNPVGHILMLCDGWYCQPLYETLTPLNYTIPSPAVWSSVKCCLFRCRAKCLILGPPLFCEVLNLRKSRIGHSKATTEIWVKSSYYITIAVHCAGKLG